MNRLWRRLLRNAIGAICIAIGIVGGFIPILQGWMFILAGLLLLDWPGRKWLLRKLRHTRLFLKTEVWVFRHFGLRFDPDEEEHPPAEPP